MMFGLIHHNQPDLETFEAFLEFAAGAGFDSDELFPEDYWSGGGEQPE
jgi:sugar phosphate isomerase/epimerase